MRIVLDARIIYTSTGRYVERLLHHLQAIDQENQYIVLLLAKDYARWEPSSNNFTKLVADYPIYSLREQLFLAVKLYRLRPDLVHFTMPQQPILYMGRKVTTVHDLTLIEYINTRKLPFLKGLYKNKLKPAVFRWVMKVVVRSSRVIITPTHFVKNQILKRFGILPEKIIVTYEAAEPALPKTKEYSDLRSKKFLLYVGNAFPYKNLERLIDAHKLTGQEYALVLVGKRDYFYEKLEEYGIKTETKGVIFTGFVPDEQLAWLYQNASLFVFPSLSEGFGLPPLEAMAAGTPVISSNASCMPEVLGDAAAYFDPRDPADMAAKIQALLDNPKELERLRKAGLEQVKKYSWRKMAEETLAVYKQALEKK